MNRRAFLRSLATLTAAAIAAPEMAVESLWQPSRVYFDIGARPHFASSFVKEDWVTREILRQFKFKMLVMDRVAFSSAVFSDGDNIRVKFSRGFGRA